MPIIYDRPAQYSGSLTLDDLIQEVQLQLHGYSAKGDQVTALAADLSSSATTLRVDDVSQVSRGIIEIDDELMRVQTVDRTSGTITVLPQGRGWRGTRAASHAAGATVIMSPLVAKVQIANAINDTVCSLYPDLFGVGSVEYTVTSPSTVAYELPEEAEMVLRVDYLDGDGNWQRVRHWELENAVSAADFASGKAIRIGCGGELGRKLRVAYGIRPTPMSSGTSAFADTGLANSQRDIVLLGAQARIIPALDVARLTLRTVSADELDQPVQLGSAVSLAKEILTNYDRRVRQEKLILQNRYPAPVHFVR